MFSPKSTQYSPIWHHITWERSKAVIETSSLDWREHKGSGHIITDDELLSGRTIRGWILDPPGVTKFFPQENGRSADARVGGLNAVSEYLRSCGCSPDDLNPPRASFRSKAIITERLTAYKISPFVRCKGTDFKFSDTFRMSGETLHRKVLT